MKIDFDGIETLLLVRSLLYRYKLLHAGQNTKVMVQHNTEQLVYDGLKLFRCSAKEWEAKKLLRNYESSDSS